MPRDETTIPNRAASKSNIDLHKQTHTGTENSENRAKGNELEMNEQLGAHKSAHSEHSHFIECEAIEVFVSETFV